MLVSLKDASELVGKHRSTLHRAMVAGRLSYSVGDNGDRLIDTSELDRVYGIQQTAPESRNDASSDQCNDTKLAELRAQLELERAKAVLLTDQVRDLREDRDRWRSMAEQSTRLLTDGSHKESSGFWKRLFRRFPHRFT